MTDTSDWADDVAEIITRDMIYSNYGQKDIDRIAAALRKAKADGMREAIFRFEQRYNNVDPYEDIYWFGEMAELLRGLADKLEADTFH